MGVTFIAKEGTYTAPAKLITKEITENNTYNASDDGANGYSSVTVNVEGGGGSSDFSTATVTTINNSNQERLGITVPTACEENELGEGSPAMIYNVMVIPQGTSTHKVPMYKGLAYCGDVFVGGLTITTSGNISYENEVLTITGDGTITIS